MNDSGPISLFPNLFGANGHGKKIEELLGGVRKKRQGGEMTHFLAGVERVVKVFFLTFGSSSSNIECHSRQIRIFLLSSSSSSDNG